MRRPDDLIDEKLREIQAGQTTPSDARRTEIVDDLDEARHHTLRMNDGGDAIFGRTDTDDESEGSLMSMETERAFRIALIYGEGAVNDEIIADLILDLAALADKDYGGIEHRLRVVEVGNR